MGTVVRIAKASESDIKSTEMLLELLENIFFSDNFKSTPVYNKICSEMGYPDGVPVEYNDSVRLECIRRYFNNCSGRWIKVINTADVMIDQICSKEVGYIELNSFLKRASNNTILGE